ncbi:MAG: ribonuclease P protein component [Candidatus Gastranaerophilales bacterium]|nr:ribonuclease P protein component [Candidatus Gastranaerophilales bacterium]
MLQKKYRLKKYSAFTATYKQRNIAADSNMCIYFGKEKTDFNVPTKIGFVVSKKIHKRAVVRNRIKRLMRENFRLLLKEKEIENINKYLSVICTAKSPLIGAESQIFRTTLKSLILKKA